MEEAGLRMCVLQPAGVAAAAEAEVSGHFRPATGLAGRRPRQRDRKSSP